MKLTVLSMEIKLKRGMIEEGKADFYFIGIEHYDDFDWFLDFFLQMPDTTLIKKVDGIYSRLAWLLTREVRYTLIHHEDIGYYSQLSDGDSEENLRKLEQILNEVLETIV